MDKPMKDNTESGSQAAANSGGPDSGTGSGGAQQADQTRNTPTTSDENRGNGGGDSGKYSAKASDKTSQQQASGTKDGGTQEHHGFLASLKERLDNKLIEIFQGAKERAMDKAEDIGIVARLRVEEWLDKTEMDDKARAQWEKVKGDGKLFGAQLENRITHLIANGQIVWANWKQKIDEARDEAQQAVDKVENKVEEAIG